MNNTWTYWQLFWMVKLWFISRWWDILSDDQTIMNYINLAIQDLYNEDNSTWRYQIEELNWISNWSTTKYITTFPIHKLQKCNPYYLEQINTDENKDLIPTLFWINNLRDVMFNWNEILTHSNITKIRVIYLRDYEFVSLQDITKSLPLPNRYIPALLKLIFDWWAPINLLAWETQMVDFYSHWITRSNKLASNDSLTDFMDVNPAY